MYSSAPTFQYPVNAETVQSSHTSSLLPLSIWSSLVGWIPLAELQTDTVHAMPFVRRSRIPLALEHMPEMPSAVRADDLGTRHAQRAISMSGNSAGNGVEKGRPAAAGSKLVARLVQRRVTRSTCVDAVRRRVLIVFAREGCFRPLLSKNPKLLYIQRSLVARSLDHVRSAIEH